MVFSPAGNIRNNGVYVRVRNADVRALRLENRRLRKRLVSSNLTLSATVGTAWTAGTVASYDCPVTLYQWKCHPKASETLDPRTGRFPDP
jgi:hypothetical protein